MGGTAAHGNTPPQPPSASLLTLRSTTPDPDKSVQRNQREAAVALDKNYRSTALAKFRQVAGDNGLPQPYRDLGTIRATALEFDAIAPDQVISRLESMAKAGNPWFGSAGEMTALAYLKQCKKAEAGRMFAAVAADKQVPRSIRSRAVQIAGTLGVDASASLPALEQQD